MRAHRNIALSVAVLALALAATEPAAAATGISAARVATPRVLRHHRHVTEEASATAPVTTPTQAPRGPRHPSPTEGRPAPTPTPEPAPEAEPVGPEPGPEPAGPESGPAPLLEAGFEQGLAGWNTAGLGESMPSVVSDIVRSGSHSAKFALTGGQNRSELILGGSGGEDTADAVRFGEGAEYWYGFSFYIVSMVYGHPGAHNLIMQFKGDDKGSPAFGLQLWDYEGDDGEYRSSPKGLWSAGTAMGGDRFLAPAAERQWHDVAIHFKASRVGAGFYEVFLDGNLVDSRSGTSMLVPEATHGYIKDGIYRNGGTIPGTSEIRLDDARLGTSYAAVSAG